jgi:hypothetical protein
MTAPSPKVVGQPLREHGNVERSHCRPPKGHAASTMLCRALGHEGATRARSAMSRLTGPRTGCFGLDRVPAGVPVDPEMSG